MTKPVLYQLPFSAPCRSVQMLADVLNLDLELKSCDLLKGEHLQPEYLKINPHHTIPTLVDDGFSLYESRAILTYLASKYAPTSSLYPTDLKKRALVDQALQFDGTTLYPSFGAVVYPIIRLGAKVNPDLVKVVEEKLALFNDDLGRHQYVAGNELTVADLSLLATYTSIEAVGLFETSKLANVQAWVQRLKDSGKLKKWDELVVSTSAFFGQWIKDKLKSN